MPSRMGACNALWRAVTRTKTLDQASITDTNLKRCLTTLDLTTLGVGSTLGAGVYVLTGHVAKSQAGPATCLSFLIAAVASLLAAVCYAELASRVPRAGSSYTYSYVSVGELVAFVIGWNLLLENMIGAASVAKAASEYFDSLLNDTVRLHIESVVGTMNIPLLAHYPDFLAFGITILGTILLTIGVKMSSVVNSVMTAVNLLVILLIICIGASKVDGHNWTDPPGFFPFGFKGVLSGAATCFYAFIGFDAIATSGEEAKKPARSIPTAIFVTLVISFLAFFGVSTVLTLMVPFSELSPVAALPRAFSQRGIPGVEIVIAVGGLCGLTAAMMASLFALPRIVYSMACDGLVFRCLGSISSYTDTPFVASLIGGLLTAILAMFLNLESLIEMMSIGALMAYTLCAVSILALRYQKESIGLTATSDYEDIDTMSIKSDQVEKAAEHTGLVSFGSPGNKITYVQNKVFKRVSSKRDDDSDDEDVLSAPPPPPLSQGTIPETTPAEPAEPAKKPSERQVLKRMAQLMSEPVTPPDSTYHRVDSNYSINSFSQLFNIGEEFTREPSECSRNLALSCMMGILLSWAGISVLCVFGLDAISTWWSILILCLFSVVIISCFVVMYRQPQNSAKLNFTVPFIPAFPLLSIMINIYLMVALSPATWIRFGIWMMFGTAMYLGYGIWHSTERRRGEDEVILYNVADTESILVDGVYR